MAPAKIAAHAAVSRREHAEATAVLTAALGLSRETAAYPAARRCPTDGSLRSIR
jgi:hypothetical protein